MCFDWERETLNMAAKFSRNFTIAEREIGVDQAVFIVAEAGVAHFGSVEKAKALVDMAVAAQADAVKFQMFNTRELISKESKDWIERMQSKELPLEAFREIRDYCSEQRIIFFATAHDEPSLESLDSLQVPVYKIGSGEIENWPFLRRVASRNKPVIFSTGMYTLEQIETALGVFAETGNSMVAVLHCVTQYPTPASNVNLKAMEAIRSNFDVLVGYSDHTQGFHFPIAAVALGAKIIEKHISLDFNIPNAQDWKVSCGPEDLRAMVHQIREIESGLGSHVKVPGEGEIKNLSWARKSLVAACDISKGEVITVNMLCTKRPGDGISPARIDEVVGRRANINIERDKLIRWEQLN
jgi:sialic acid synthase SpsE